MSDTELLAEALEELERAGCGFQFCAGPTLEPIDMVTCGTCWMIARLRQRLGRPIREEGIPEGAVEVKAAEYAAYMRQCTAGPSRDGCATIVGNFNHGRRY